MEFVMLPAELCKQARPVGDVSEERAAIVLVYHEQLCTMPLVRPCEIKIIGDEIIVSLILVKQKVREELEEESHLQLT
jgi:hypothetical protein